MTPAQVYRAYVDAETRRDEAAMSAVLAPDIAIELNSTITLPEWHRPEEADSALVAAWNQYLVDLRSHENGHRVLAYRTASEIRRALDRLRVEDCAFIVNEARKVGEGILARHGQDGAEFDADPANRVTWPPRSR